MSWPRAAAGVITATLLAACGSTGQPATRSPSFSPATTVAGHTLTGNAVSLASMRGHPVVLVFWASWCGPCHDEQPRLNAAYSRWSPRGVRFLGVDMLDDTPAALSFQHQLGVPYPSVVDNDGNIAAGYLVPAAPAIVLVSATGGVASRVLGGLDTMSDSDLDTAISHLLPVSS